MEPLVWRFRGYVLSGKNDDNLYLASTQKNRYSLKILNISQKNFGLYSCEKKIDKYKLVIGKSVLKESGESGIIK